MKIVVVRHAEKGREGNEASVPISDRGRESARACGLWLRDQGVRPAAVAYTRAVRTKDTAELVLPPDGNGEEQETLVRLFGPLDTGVKGDLETWFYQGANRYLYAALAQEVLRKRICLRLEVRALLRIHGLARHAGVDRSNQPLDLLRSDGVHLCDLGGLSHRCSSRRHEHQVLLLIRASISAARSDDLRHR